MQALVTGATGFVGRRLLAELDAPHVLSRNAESAAELAEQYGGRVFEWRRPAEDPPPGEAFDGVDTVFHLAGDPVASGRWNAEKKERILASRRLGTRNLVAAIGSLEDRPRTFISASAVGFYGDRGDEELAESSAPQPNNFLSQVCQVWEDEARRGEEFGLRVASIRIGIVLGRGGGALSKMAPPIRCFVGGRLGNGRQWMPWIHVDDLVRLFLHAAALGAAPTYNGSAPNPLRNSDFTRQLGKQLNRPTVFPAPGFALKLAVGEFGGALLESQRALPRAALDEGFEFKFPHLAEALADIL
ncbi:MAG: TIGR01777 family oxidoreductase [Pirellulaceae bacterium]|jgi:hypothetical protein|nr:TIGR01777 family oxidoreductase [Pirellulaceae bacterium]